MTQFRERNPIPIALIGLVVLLALVGVAFEAANIPFLGGGGTTYHAAFQESSDLNKGDDVRVAGIKVGTVSSITLSHGHVEVGMRVKGVDVGSTSSADIKIKTLLGQMYVDLQPSGPGTLSNAGIPMSRTTTPLIVTTAFEGFASRVTAIDTNQVAASFDAISRDFSNTNDGGQVKQTLDGLTAVSKTISSRDAQLKVLLANAEGVTQNLASRDAQITLLINDGNTVLALVNQQRDVIHALLVNTSTLSKQLEALVAENTAVLKPALTQLGTTLDILTKDQTSLDSGLHLLAPFLRDFSNVLGNGRWFDSYITNLTSASGLGCFTISAGGQTLPNPSTGCAEEPVPGGAG